MDNIEQVNPFTSTIIKTSFGTLITLVTDVEISTKGSISFGDKTLLANYIYTKDGTYKLVYTTIDTDGNTESFCEADGILPTLFLSPTQENYVSIVPYHPDKELEISIPIFNRESIEIPKGNRPFVGKFIGTSNQYSIFYDVDWSKTKPDKLLAIEFKNNTIKKKHTLKIPLPANNKIVISDNEIHLLAKEENRWLHRQIDALGNELTRRIIDTEKPFFWQIIRLSFNRNSYLLAQENGKIIIEKIAIDGKSETIELMNFEDRFFNTWQPIKISEDIFVTHYNGEFGNGWFTTQNDQLLEFFYSKGEHGYKDLLTNKVLRMDRENLIISSITKTTDKNYAVVFYPMTDTKIQNNELIILNRGI